MGGFFVDRSSGAAGWSHETSSVALGLIYQGSMWGLNTTRSCQGAGGQGVRMEDANESFTFL